MKIRIQEDPEDKRKEVYPKTLKKPVTWETHMQGHTGMDRTTRRI